VRLTLAAFVPVLRAFERMLGPAIGGLIWPDWQASQRPCVEMLCRTMDKRVIWVSELGGTPVGFIACDPDLPDRTAEIQLISVHPDYRNRGVGSALNVIALERIRESGIKLTHVDTGDDPAHAPARRSYEKARYIPMSLVRYFKDL
jgi:ribosomal protein S18 acetylase RimI-like enzyme